MARGMALRRIRGRDHVAACYDLGGVERYRGWTMDGNLFDI